MEGGEGQPEMLGMSCSLSIKMLQSVGGSFPASGWTGTRCASEYKGPEAYPPNNTTVSIERR